MKNISRREFAILSAPIADIMDGRMQCEFWMAGRQEVRLLRSYSPSKLSQWLVVIRSDYEDMARFREAATEEEARRIFNFEVGFIRKYYWR